MKEYKNNQKWRNKNRYKKIQKKFENINEKKMKLNKTNLIQGENLNKQQIDHYTA